MNASSYVMEEIMKEWEFICAAVIDVDTGLEHVMNSWLSADASLADMACLN